MTTIELRDRRQRAREAYFDALQISGEDGPNGFEAAVETATRVRVDADITQAARDAVQTLPITRAELKKMIEAAFVAAGFEVEQ